MSTVHASYYTDPACAWSWALEPALRRLEVEFGEEVQITYVMGGLAREFGRPEPLLAEWLAAGEHSQMPVDPRIWLEGAPASSFPACLAVKAAGEQGDPGPYLRRVREGLMCGRRKLDTTEALVEEARALGTLDVERFRIDLRSNAIVELFGADLERAGAVPVEHHAPATSRVRLPALELEGEDGRVHDGVYGPASIAELRAAILAAGAEPRTNAPLAVEEALRRFAPMAAVEVAAVCELPGPRAPAELWRLALEWRVRPERRLTGELWTLA